MSYTPISDEYGFETIGPREKFTELHKEKLIAFFEALDYYGPEFLSMLNRASYFRYHDYHSLKVNQTDTFVMLYDSKDNIIHGPVGFDGKVWDECIMNPSILGWGPPKYEL